MSPNFVVSALRMIPNPVFEGKAQWSLCLTWVLPLSYRTVTFTCRMSVCESCPHLHASPATPLFLSPSLPLPTEFCFCCWCHNLHFPFELCPLLHTANPATVFSDWCGGICADLVLIISFPMPSPLHRSPTFLLRPSLSHSTHCPALFLEHKYNQDIPVLFLPSTKNPSDEAPHENQRTPFLIYRWHETLWTSLFLKCCPPLSSLLLDSLGFLLFFWTFLSVSTMAVASPDLTNVKPSLLFY